MEIKKVISSVLAICLTACLVLTACTPANPVVTDPTGENNNTQPSSNDVSNDTAWSHDAALTRFLEDVNHNGKIGSTDELVPPGTLPEPWQIPRASQELVGETVSIILAQEQQAIPFYYYQKMGDSVERLAVFIGAERIPMLVVFETKLGGIKKLYEHILNETEFQGKILSITNISFEEGNIYAYNVCANTEGVLDSELINSESDLEQGECIGIVGTDSSGNAVRVVKGGRYDTASDSLQHSIDWMKRLFDRFGLSQYKFEELLGDPGSFYNRALTCDFASAKEINLFNFFHGLGSAEPTAEEWAALKDKPGYREEYDFFRLPANEMNEILVKYLGVTLDQIDPAGFKGLQYLESTNCYYYMATGMVYLPGVGVSKVESLDGETIRVYYKGSYLKHHVVTLKPVEGGYQLISNIEVIDPQDPELAYFNELFRQGDERNPYFYAKCVMYDFASPEELNLWSFYDGGFAGEHEITDDELAEYRKLLPPDIPELVGDFNRLPRDKVEEELQTIFGISLADLPDSAFTGLFYLKCSDSYCFNQGGMTSDFAKSQFTSLEHNDDGTISLFYEDRDGKCAITLKQNGDRYHVVSNVHVK